MTDIPTLAAGLTDQMRSALTWPAEVAGKVRLIPNTLYAQTITGIERRGLSDPATYALTPLGLQVRDYLLRSEGR